MSKNKVVKVPNTTASMKPQAPKESKRALGSRAAKAAEEARKAEKEKNDRLKLEMKIREAKAKDPKWHKQLVPALDALIGDPEILEPKENSKLKAAIMYIPDQYIDRVCDWRDELSTRGEAAKNLLRIFSDILEKIHDDPDGSKLYTCENGMKIRFVSDVRVPHGTDRKSATANALAVANYYNQEPDADIAILTGDNFMAAKASKNDIDVARINPDVYTGRRELEFPKDTEALDQWLYKGYLTEKMFHKYFPAEKPLKLNEFVEFIIPDDEITCRLTNGADRGVWNYIGRFYCVMGEDGKPEKEPCLQQLSYIKELPSYLKPKNNGQAMFAEALLAPPEEIPIVICPSKFGTGKTYLAVGIGLHLVEKGDFMRLFVVPRDSELGKDIGFLPGTEFEKTIAKAMPIVDNIESYLKNRWAAKGNGAPKVKKGKKDGGNSRAKSKGSRKYNSDKDAFNAELVEEIAATVEKSQSKKDENVFAAPEGTGVKVGLSQLKEWTQKIIKKLIEFVSVINMGGRNISDSWIIYDEAQDLERFQMNQLMKRIGDNSKMIITGDPHQVFNRHMNERSNGLSYAATKMAGSPYAAIISMYKKSEVTRSAAAQEIGERLDH